MVWVFTDHINGKSDPLMQPFHHILKIYWTVSLSIHVTIINWSRNAIEIKKHDCKRESLLKERSFLHQNASLTVLKDK